MSQRPLSSLEMNTLSTLKNELYSLKTKDDTTDQERTVIAWIESRIAHMLEKTT